MQALQLLYGGDDPWLRERELSEGDLPAHRAWLSGARPRPGALAGVRAPPYGRAPAADPARAPDPHASGRSAGARASGPPRRHPGAAGARRPRVPARATGRSRPRCTGHSASSSRRASTGRAAACAWRASRRSGHRVQRPRARAPEPAAHPRGTAAGAVRGRIWRTTLERLYPLLLDALWKSPDPDEALNQFERLPRRHRSARRLRRAARQGSRSPPRPRQGLRGRRAAHRAPDRPARAARVAGRSRACPGAEVEGGPAPGHGVRLRIRDDAGRAARSAAPREAGRGAGRRLALPPRRHHDRRATRAR